jgi:hypothetical protein
MKDFYKILGVRENASEQEIRERWIELTKRYHPDRSEESTSGEKIREINEAYQVLKHSSTRLEYDLKTTYGRREKESKRGSYFKKLGLPAGILIISMIIGVIYFTTQYRDILLVMYLMLVITAIVYIGTKLSSSIDMLRSVETWMENGIRFDFNMRYNVAEVRGSSPDEKAKNLVFSVFDKAEAYYEKHPDRLKPNLATESGFVFDLACYSDNSLLLVKHLDNKEPVTEKDLEIIKKEAAECKGNLADAEVIVVSRTQYTDGAKSFAKGRGLPRSDILFDLIIQKDDSYVAAQVGRRVLG